MKRVVMIICAMLAFTFFANAQLKTFVFTETMEDFVNPERGFYVPIEARSSNYKSLTIEQLQSLRSPRLLKGLNTTIGVSLVYRGFLLDSFLNTALSDNFLQKMRDDFAAVRAAGMKLIVRFAYTNKTHSGDCPDQYKICPPYGDVPKALMLQHIAQLKPVLTQNADVIAVVQMGFIGIWGENYFTDYFGDASTNGLGKVMDSSWNDRNDILHALLAAVPADRMVQVRTPQMKQRFVFGPNAPVSAAPLSEREAFSGMEGARIGFHNDCFLASVDDYGTFYDYGNSSSPRGPANDVLRKYFIDDSKYVPVGGETCDNTFSPDNDCSPAGHAEQEMRSMHYSYLNSAYNMAVIKDWETGGCIRSINRNLGYRFVLRSASFDPVIKKGKTFHFHAELENIGYASPFNQRILWLIFRHVQNHKVVAVKCKADIRRWFSGKISLDEDLSIPAGLTAGKYELMLSLPDVYSSLAKNPAYSIRFANDNVWEPQTGYNNLHVLVEFQ